VRCSKSCYRRARFRVIKAANRSLQKLLYLILPQNQNQEMVNFLTKLAAVSQIKHPQLWRSCLRSSIKHKRAPNRRVGKSIHRRWRPQTSRDSNRFRSKCLIMRRWLRRNSNKIQRKTSPKMILTKWLRAQPLMRKRDKESCCDKFGWPPRKTKWWLAWRF
jgi:hypothetical protein